MINSASRGTAIATLAPRVVESWQAVDTRDYTAAPSIIQANWLTNRFGLSAARARIIAPLVFGEVRM